MSLNKATERTCAMYRSAIEAGESPSDVVGQIANAYGVQRPAIWRRLRTGGVLPGYRSKSDPQFRKPQTRYKRQDSGSKMGNIPAPVFREPCPRCGVRADIGCGHTATRLVSA